MTVSNKSITHENSLIPLLSSGSPRTSYVLNFSGGISKALRIFTTPREKPHMGCSGLPFIKTTTGYSDIAACIFVRDSWERNRRKGFELRLLEIALLWSESWPKVNAKAKGNCAKTYRWPKYTLEHCVRNIFLYDFRALYHCWLEVTGPDSSLLVRPCRRRSRLKSSWR